MRSINKFILGFTLTMIITVFQVFADESTVLPFKDIPNKHYAYESIAKLYELGIVSGINKEEFGLGFSIKRSEFVEMTINTMSWERVLKDKGSFDDNTDRNKWYFSGIETGVSHGLVKTNVTLFRPEQPITREEMAIMAINALGYGELAEQLQNIESPFIDVTSNKGYIVLAKDFGIISGYGDNSFNPKATATREHAVIIINNLYKCKDINIENIYSDINDTNDFNTQLINHKKGITYKFDKDYLPTADKEMMFSMIDDLTHMNRALYTNDGYVAVNYLNSLLMEYGYDTKWQHFYFHEATEKYKNMNIPSFAPHDLTDTNYQKYGESKNIITVKKASIDSPILILSAHHDCHHLGSGAVDNATGVAMLLEIARQMNGIDTNFEIRFVFFGAEEKGLAGSKYYVDSLSKDEKDRIIANISVDSIAEKGFQDADIIVTGEGNDRAIEILKSVSELENTTSHQKDFGISDYASFSEQGIPSALFTGFYETNYLNNLEGDALILFNQNYKRSCMNTVNDKIENVDFVNLKTMTDLLLKAVMQLK